jgi:hypothetical protein
MHGSIDRLTVLLLLIGSLFNPQQHSSPLLLSLPGVSAFLAPSAAPYNSHSYDFTSARQPQQHKTNVSGVGSRSLFPHHHVVQQQRKRRFATAANTDDPANGAAPSAATDQEIEAMVLDLSREASDEIRRATLKAKLTDLLEYGAWDRAKEIDACIVGLGSRLQKQQAANGAAGNNEDGTSEEQQIWALVDMMVQTKTILNRFKQNEFRKRQEQGTNRDEQDPSSTPTTPTD